MFEYEVLEDSIKIKLFQNSIEIGSISIIETFPDYFIEDEINFLLEYANTEEEKDQLQKLSEKVEIFDFAFHIQDIQINAEFRSQGYGSLLLEEALNYLQKEYSNYFVFLNASPLYNSLSLNDLIDFYSKYGFQVYLHQKVNANMIRF